MMFTDTHTHIYSGEFDDDRDAMIRRAAESKVLRLLLPAIDSEWHGKMLAVSGKHAGICFPMMGLHPTSVKADYRRELEILHASIPESTTPEGAAKMKYSLYALADSYGVPHRAIDQIRDATTIKMMYDYARLREGIREAKEKVKPLRAADTPGQRAPRQQGNELQSKIDRAKTTRNSADELAAVDALLRSA